MAGKKGAGENSKKAAGNAKKAEAAAAKQAVENSKKAKAEEEEWGKGAKSNAKKEAAEQKKAEAARKKAEKDALLKEEEKAMPAAKTGNAKSAVKKPSKGLSLSQLDDGDANDEPSKPSASLNASGIDNALDALSLTASTGGEKVERHPERRFPAAFAKFKETRLEQLKTEQPGLRKQQREDLAYKEFQKHPDNPYNQVTASYDTSKEDLREIREKERAKVEGRLAGK